MSAVPAIWAYRARPVKVIDGDTLDVALDAGFRNFREERLRLLGLNTPERKGETRKAGDAARLFVVDWLSWLEGMEWPLTIQTAKSDAFGRYLARIWRTTDGRCLNEDLLAAGHAVVFMAD